MADQPLVERFNLRSRLRFNIESGQIWLDENRMLLLHAKAFGALRHELFESLGAQRVKGLLFRMGFVSGQHDADLARKLYGEADNYDIFQIGLELHAFEGLVRTTISEADIDWEEGVFYGKVHCESSWEAESHLQLMGATDEPVCWSLAGYASGYVLTKTYSAEAWPASPPPRYPSRRRRMHRPLRVNREHGPPARAETALRFCQAKAPVNRNVTLGTPLNIPYFNKIPYKSMGCFFLA